MIVNPRVFTANHVNLNPISIFKFAVRIMTNLIRSNLFTPFTLVHVHIICCVLLLGTWPFVISNYMWYRECIVAYAWIKNSACSIPSISASSGIGVVVDDRHPFIFRNNCKRCSWSVGIHTLLQVWIHITINALYSSGEILAWLSFILTECNNQSWYHDSQQWLILAMEFHSKMILPTFLWGATNSSANNIDFRYT